jgi:hypothetical protein
MNQTCITPLQVRPGVTAACLQHPTTAAGMLVNMSPVWYGMMCSTCSYTYLTPAAACCCWCWRSLPQHPVHQAAAGPLHTGQPWHGIHREGGAGRGRFEERRKQRVATDGSPLALHTISQVPLLLAATVSFL